jgi:ABC-2 type transport system ATP-binding protein
VNIHFDRVTKKYGRTVALNKVSVDFKGGEIVAVVGPNGAGKTTLLRSLATIIAPNRGQILLDNEVLRRDRLELRRRMLFLPDIPAAYSHFTPLNHIAMVLRLYGKDQPDIEPRVAEVLKQLDLLPLIGTRLANMSRGQAYKTTLAALFLVDPDLWLLDEPLASGIDPAGIIYLKQQCRDAAARGRTVIYSTQLLDVAEKFSDRVCILYRGGVQFFDSVEQARVQAAGPQKSLEDIFAQLREEGQ